MARKGGKDRGVFERMKPCPSCAGADGGCDACGHHKKGKVGTGVWYVRWTDKFGRDHKKSIGAKSKAKDVHAKIRSTLIDEVFFPERLDKKRQTLLKAAIDAYLVESKSTKRTWKDDERFGTAWKDALGEIAMSAVRPDDVEAWRRAHRDEMTPATINRYVAFLKRVFNVAIRDGRCKENPVARIKMLKENNARDRFLSYDEEKKLKEACPEAWWPLVEVAILTGLRQSEQLGLRWEHVDFDTGQITVPRSKHGERRRVPMSRRVRQILLEAPSRGGSPWVYPCDGLPDRRITTWMLRTVWEAAVEKAGLQNLHWHDLRHTFGSRLVMNGVDIRTVQELMGHKTITMTQRYAHLAPDHLADAIERVTLPPPSRT